jgi:thioredoxin-like negative regulator of GroEL
MDSVAPLASQVVAVLAPFLPHLVTAGQRVAEEVGDELGEHGGEIARALWQRLGPRIEAKPASQEAVQDAAANPKDADAQAALRVQIRKLLTEDTALATELTELLNKERPAGSVTTVTASGTGSIAAGRDIQAGTIVTGDNNRLG